MEIRSSVQLIQWLAFNLNIREIYQLKLWKTNSTNNIKKSLNKTAYRRLTREERLNL